MLQKLAERLVAQPGGTVSTLLTNILEGLNYDEWEKQAKKAIKREAIKSSDAVDAFVKRFSSKRQP